MIVLNKGNDAWKSQDRIKGQTEIVIKRNGKIVYRTETSRLALNIITENIDEKLMSFIQ